ncbi:MAG TPA: YfiR family protein [Verrucomicrobiae bacterium]|nr:YfiR family protein [Verrucomicrobiae bacterium]
MNFFKHGWLSARGTLDRAACVFAVGTLAVALIGDAEEPSPRALEYHVKAGFLYTFAKYVEWPTEAFASPTNAIVIGVLGEDPFNKILDATVDGKAIDGRPIRILRFQQVDKIETCQVLFISVSERDRLADILTRLRGRSILTVSELNGFLQHGGHIHFVTEDSRVKFDIDLNATRRAGLKLDANLLRVARHVVRHGSETRPE